VDVGWGGVLNQPAQVSGLSNVVAICAGGYHRLALDVNGQVRAWGDNYYGQLGDGGSEWSSDQPVLVAGLTNVIKIAAGVVHSLALDGEGRLWAWGDDSAGQLGDGGLAGKTNLPLQVSGLSNIVVIAAGSDASAAVDADNHVW
jgi:alpha-tubulin suppressor-like RCC1 family protein